MIHRLLSSRRGVCYHHTCAQNAENLPNPRSTGERSLSSFNRELKMETLASKVTNHSPWTSRNVSSWGWSGKPRTMCSSNSNSTPTTLPPIVAHLQIQQIQPIKIHCTCMMAGENRVILYSPPFSMAMGTRSYSNSQWRVGGWGMG